MGFEAGKQGPRKIILASGWLEFVLLRRLSCDPFSYHACRQFSNGRPQQSAPALISTSYPHNTPSPERPNGLVICGHGAQNVLDRFTRSGAAG